MKKSDSLFNIQPLQPSASVCFTSMQRKRRLPIGHVKLQQSKYSRHSSKLSEVEIDMRLKEYFGKNQVLTRSRFQDLCELTKTTAGDRLRKLREAGKLDNIGLRTQPIYVPMPGYYGVSKDMEATL